MDLKTLGAQWNELGRTDPMWAVVSWPEKAGGRWDADEFFATGVAEIDGVMAHLSSLGRAQKGGRGLDFGCGLGRLSLALAGHCDSVDGVDIASSMVERARSHNPSGDRMRFHLNEENSLRLFADSQFDLIYSSITLQHMNPKYARVYLKEFVRVLRPGGTIVFQLPSHPAWTPKGLLWRFLPMSVCGFLLRFKNKSAVHMEMHGIRRACVVQLLENAGAKMVDVRNSGESGSDWVSYLYTATK